MMHFNTISYLAKLFKYVGLRNLVVIFAISISFLSIPYLSAEDAPEEQHITVYSFRKQKLIQPLIMDFEKNTGIKVKLISAPSSGLLNRLINEGRSTRADVVIANSMVDIYSLDHTNGLLRTLPHYSNQAFIKDQFKSQNNKWVALTARARVIVYNSKKIGKQKINSYNDLALPYFAKKVCVRPSGNDYDPSLIASMITHLGEESVESWLKGFVSNFARPPQGNDRAQIRDVARGVCDVALVNSYYMVLMLNSDSKEDKKLARQVGVQFPNRKTTGTHINISAIGMVRYSNKEKLVSQFINHLTSVKSQNYFTRVNYEYPVRKDAVISNDLSQLGYPLVFDKTTIEEVVPNVRQAVLMIDNAQWK